MDIPGSKLLELAVNLLREAPSALLKLARWSERHDLERCIVALRAMYAEPGGVLDWLDGVERNDGAVTDELRTSLCTALDTTSASIGAALKRIDELSLSTKEAIVTMELQEYLLFRRLVRGKGTFRGRLQKIAKHCAEADASKRIPLTKDELQSLRVSIGAVNSQIEEAHNRLVGLLDARKSTGASVKPGEA